MLIHERVKALRLAADLSLDRAANGIGISKAHLWAFEQGQSKNPTLRMVSGMAKFYGLTIIEFVNGSSKPRLTGETMAAMMAVNEAIQTAYRRGYADGKSQEPSRC